MKLILKPGIVSFIFISLLWTGCSTFYKSKEQSKQSHHSAFKTKKGKRIYLQSYDKALKSLWGVPFEEMDIETPFGIAHIIASGEKNKPSLVLLHGMNASSTMWYPNAKAFSQKYRVYCIDFILEPGKSVSNGSISKVDDLITWYDLIFDQLKLDKFPVVGESRGGWMAMQLALHSKKKITKIAILSPAHAFTWIKPKKEIFKNIFFEIFPQRKHLRSVLKTMMTDVDKLSQLYINQYYLAVTKSKKSSSILQVKPFTDDELKALNVPVLLLIGDTDIINNEEGLNRAKKIIPQIKASIINKAGHFISFDQPEIVNKVVLAFLEER